MGYPGCHGIAGIPIDTQGWAIDCPDNFRGPIARIGPEVIFYLN